MGDRRSSLLVDAGNALASLRFSRRRPSLRQPVDPPHIEFSLPNVIDISAPPPDFELEERQRLRDAAAQSIGLGPLTEDAVEETVQEDAVEPNVPPPAIPAFPATTTAVLNPLLAATLPKHYPHHSLRLFALTKPWKTRHILLSAGHPSQQSHLHLFKGSSKDDQELERLAIGPDSVVFVADSATIAPLDHRAQIVKVGGDDVGARRKEWNTTDDAGRTVWLIHFPNSTEAQRWISAIKNAILEQRSQRAGLAPLPSTGSPQEPRGDMDVMLTMRSMHAASKSSPSSPPTASPIAISPSPTLSPQDQRPATSHRETRRPRTPSSPTTSLAPSSSARSISMSIRSAATTPQPKTQHGQSPSVSAVAALKGLFSGSGLKPDGRPRSSSAASVTSGRSFSTSVRSLSPPRSVSMSSSPRPTSLVRALSASGRNKEEGQRSGSFARMGSILAGGSGQTSRAKATLPVGGGAPVSSTPEANGALDLERRIVRQAERGASVDITANGNGHVHSASEPTSGKRRTLGALTLTSLQPPPRARKRWTAGSAPPVGSVSAHGHMESVSAREEDEEADVMGNAYAGSTNGHGGSPSTTGSFFYAHPHANGSAGTAGSFGVPPSVSKRRSEYGAPEGVEEVVATREDHLSQRSVSTRSRASSVGTSGTTGAGGATSRRWSTLPRRFTPPENPPPPSTRTIPHPYAAQPERETRERAPSRSSGRSFGSSLHELSAPPSANGTGWGRGGTKRASAISVGSVSIGGTSVASASSAGTGSRVRASVPPPPRPAPTSALPPAPADGGSPNGRTSFRESGSSPTTVTTTGNKSFRALRLSLKAPKPPPAGLLPPRPDEPVVESNHVLKASNGRVSMNGAGPAHPPPRGPLPPTPSEPTSSLRAKQRLRMLSAPPAPHPSDPPPMYEFSNPSSRRISMDGVPSSPTARPLASFLSTSTPATPTTATPSTSFATALGNLPTQLGEKIVQPHTQNDPSFLQMTPISTPVLRPLPTLPMEPPPEIASLPPPRRGSRQISIKEMPERTITPEPEPEPEPTAPLLPLDQAASEGGGTGPGPGKLFSLSRHGSVISLGIVTV
ncbi:hypothetical protein FB45DRAFT_896711 [Roridomyces roridus]|uniref:PH domain-containing protein n=1 Tax=Roridomyces roridus TaxID=1738132 RepID=A0AAD7FXT7_9AGAR|nr:hypothetical protein FB45DRAFT_896711 [Roridomyces roridus]